MNFNRLSRLSNLVTNDLKRKPTIILEQMKLFRMKGTDIDININIDADHWEIPDNLTKTIEVLNKSNDSNEEKILKIYQKICEEYTYDDNVLSYIKKNDDETFFLPDFYGRNTDYKWKENRKKHNRRSCFEVSRILAKSINEVLKSSKDSKKYDVCILWDEAVTHYLVGLVSDEYCVSLDLDDFTQIKDLTRMKTGLTLEGIKILDDPSNKFRAVLEKFNENRDKFAKEHIKSEREKFAQRLHANTKDEHSSTDFDIESDDVTFLQYSINVLKENYNLDSAGIYEYLKEIVDTKIGANARKKVWREVEDNSGTGTRYTRCLLVTIDDTEYIIDVTKENANEILRKFNKEELKNPNSKVTPFNEMSRDWNEDPYDGR